MKILHVVEFYSPSVGGMQEVVKQISEELVKKGHDVTVATTFLKQRNSNVINGVKIKDFDISGNFVKGINGDVDGYKDFLIKSNFDIITLFASQQWVTDIAFEIIEKIQAKKVFVPTGFSALYNPLYKEYFTQMASWIKKIDMNVFLSEDYRDINFARENGVKDYVIIPNGASKSEFLSNYNINIREKFNIDKDSFMVLNVGTHTGLKGHKETIKIYKKSRLNNSCLLMIANTSPIFKQRKTIKQILRKIINTILLKKTGSGCSESCLEEMKKFNASSKRKRDKKRIIITSLERAETVSAYKESDLFLFTSNVECSPIVLFECMAAGLPFLTTSAGNAKEIIKWSNAGILLPTHKGKKKLCFANINKSVEILEKIYHDTNKRAKLSENGFKIWQERFTWENIASEYEKMYVNLLNQK